jgi:integrase
MKAFKSFREERKAEIEAQLERFLEKISRKGSKKTRDSYFNSLLIFCSWMQKTPNEIVEVFRSGKMNVYEVLDNYVGWLMKQNLAPHSIKNYLTAVKRFLRMYDVEIINEKLKDKVDLPRMHRIVEDRAPTSEELAKACMHTNTRGKAFITMLASSGMRIGELLALKVKDVDFSKHPTTIRLRPETAKGKQKRICFISDEATEWLKKHLGENIKNKDAWLFPSTTRGFGKNRNREEQPMTYWNADAIFTNALEKAGIREKDEKGHDILHLHTLRKFFFTQMLSVLGREITEALMGHRQYLDLAYRRFTEDQLREFYLKGMNAVTILQPASVAQVNELRRRLEKAEAKLQEYKERLNGLTEAYKEEFRELIKTKEILYSKKEMNRYIEERAKELFWEMLTTLTAEDLEQILKQKKQT